LTFGFVAGAAELSTVVEPVLSPLDPEDTSPPPQPAIATARDAKTIKRTLRIRGS
jgi:hypothetical protein